ncbi:AAA family ATPase [Bacillus licheniformis]|nr:AAA family ATPase [Bacillus licheniformis]
MKLAGGTDNLSWTRKYRPTSIGDYVGNDVMKNKLQALMRVNKLPQTMLFEGERGTGKTTFSRLLAKTMMCENPEDGQACGACPSCLHLDKNYIKTGQAPRNIPIYEFDITKMNGVQDAKEIVERMRQRSRNSEKRVFILDEVQRSSKEAQSTFLKITEEPVPGLYVILCTTNPEDLLTPFRSRFSTFKVKRPTINEITKRLAYICRNEGVDYSPDGLRLIATRCGRIPRESISRTELVATTGAVTRVTVQRELEIISEKIFTEFLSACKSGALNNVLDVVNKIEENDIQTSDFIEGLGDYVVSLLNVRSGVKLDQYGAEEIKKMRKYIKAFSDRDIVNILKVLKDYSGLKKGMRFQLYALGAEIMDATNVPETVKPISEERASKKYTEVTAEVKSSKPFKKPKPASEEDIMSVFENAKKVKE